MIGMERMDWTKNVLFGVVSCGKTEHPSVQETETRVTTERLNIWL